MNEQIFKVGDRVWCCMYGWGTVIGIHEGVTYPVIVQSDRSISHNYTHDGKYMQYHNRTLFFKEQEFDDSRPEPVYEKGYYWVEDIMGTKKIMFYSATRFDSFRDVKVICKIEEPK